MNIETLQRAIDEAERSLDRAKQARDATTENPYVKGLLYIPSVKVSACRRSSMYLTRALADLRQGR